MKSAKSDNIHEVIRDTAHIVFLKVEILEYLIFEEKNVLAFNVFMKYHKREHIDDLSIDEMERLLAFLQNYNLPSKDTEPH